MTDTHKLRNLSHSLTNVHEDLSVEQLELYQAFITKSLEFKKAEEALLSAMDNEEGGDQKTSEALKTIRRVFDDSSYRLSGSECVLLACLYKELEGEEHVETKRINIYLHSYDRKPANTTKIVDHLEKKNLIKINNDGLHSHKMYRLTKEGQSTAWSLIDRLTLEGAGERLSVMD
jgi:DNA-binding MarR family transcriptional regulator